MSDTADFQRRCSDFVGREVIICLSTLVDTLAKAYGEATGDLGELAEEAFELCTPIPDYEEAVSYEVSNWDRDQCAEYLGSLSIECRDDESIETLRKAVEANAAEEGLEEFAREHDIEPYEREVYEHWAVSNYLARRLKAHGEKVLRFNNFEVWARCTTGQAISIDGVIENIVRENEAAVAD